MAKRKQKLPPISAARLETFQATGTAPEHHEQVHAQLCNFTPAERRKWAAEYDVPIVDDLDAWGNQIIVAHAARVDRMIAAIKRTLETCAAWEQNLKDVALKREPNSLT